MVRHASRSREQLVRRCNVWRPFF